MLADPARMLEGLTEPQSEAVRHVDGPLLVLAGPGSGKTTVVTRRIAWLLAQGIPPWQILALTFTNKAAGEMRERVERIVEADLAPRGLTVATFHGFCARLLRRYADAAGVDPRYSIYDTSDQRAAIKRAIAEAGLAERNFTPAAVGSWISGAKNRLQDAEAFAATATDFHSRSVAKAYAAYERIMRASGALDFDDLLLRVALMLRRDEVVRAELQARYRYLLVDEYQDTNQSQLAIATALAAAHRNVMVVGDPDQSIYAWRGADIRNILEFEATYAEARVVPLGQNFRSTGHIVAAADVLVRNNRARKDRPLFTELGDGERPRVEEVLDEHAEAERVLAFLRERHEQDEVAWRSMAVLYRTNALSRVLEDALRHARVPYVIARGTAFYDRREIRDALAYLRVVANPGDDVALRRIVNTPARGIGRTTLDRLDAFAGSIGGSLATAMDRAAEVPGLGARAVKAVSAFATTLAGWREAAAQPVEPGGHELADLFERVVRESGLEESLRSSATEEDYERLENLGELVSAASEFLPPAVEDPGPVPDAAGDAGADGAAAAADGASNAPGDAADGRTPLRELLAAFLEQVALVSDADAIDPERGAVTLMTLHAAKGLEFDVVAVVGLEEGLLPHARSIEAPDDDGLEEERRLLFVGLTRARRHLLVTAARSRTQRGFRERTIASRFLRELPDEHVARASPPATGFLEADDPFLGGGGGAADDFPGWEAAQVDTSGEIRPGALVRHPTFGLGRVETVRRRPAGGSAQVLFQDAGTKTLILEYAPLEVVDPTEL